MTEQVLRYIEVGILLITLLVAIPGAYFSLSARVTVNEQALLTQERSVQKWYGDVEGKLGRIERKLDCVIDKRMCN